MDKFSGETFIGIDPSFTCTGLTILDEFGLRLEKVKTEPSDKSFKDIFIRSRGIADRILNSVSCHSHPRVAMETPPPAKQFSGGLYMLDSIILNSVLTITKDVFLFPPNYIGHLHKQRSYPKSLSVELFKKMIEALDPPDIFIDGKGRSSVHDVINGRKVNNDTAEAFILMSRVMYASGLFPSYSQKLDEIVPNICNSKEIIV